MLDALRNRLLTVILAIVVLASGCVSWRSIRPVSPSLEAGRRLAREGVTATERGEWTTAESLFREAVDKCPDDAELRRKLADVLWRRGATDEAVEQITTAAELAPDDVATVVQAGEMLLATGRTRHAAERARQALRLDNREPTAWALRGRTFAVQSNDQRALADFACALLLDPDATDVLLESAHIYSRRGEHQRCLATLHQLLDSLPADSVPQEVLLLEGRTYLALERPARAAERLALAAERGPTTADLHIWQAEAELAQGRFPAAERFARLALEVEANHPAAREMLQRLAQQPDGVFR